MTCLPNRLRGEQREKNRAHARAKGPKCILKFFNNLLNRPVQVRIALYPEGFMETLAKPRTERYFVLVSFPDGGGLPLHEQERVLRAARRKISSRLRQVRDKIASKPSERQERE